MILPPEFEDMTEEEILEALLEVGVRRESAELHAVIAKDPDPGFDVE